jgi:hypothetical protein
MIRAVYSEVINARPDAVHAVFSDYRVAHQAILPKPYFTEMQVTRGGQGAGTETLLRMKISGREFTYHQVVTEPEPGRILVEADREQNVVTTFTFDPMGDGSQTHLTIATELPSRPGLGGWIESLITPLVMSNIYKKEVGLLKDYLRQQVRASSPTR